MRDILIITMSIIVFISMIGISILSIYSFFEMIFSELRFIEKTFAIILLIIPLCTMIVLCDIFT